MPNTTPDNAPTADYDNNGKQLGNLQNSNANPYTNGGNVTPTNPQVIPGSLDNNNVNYGVVGANAQNGGFDAGQVILPGVGNDDYYGMNQTPNATRRMQLLGQQVGGVDQSWADASHLAGQNQDQSRQQMLGAYNQALAQANGGQTVAQSQLGNQQGIQNSSIGNMVMNAGGGARGAAAAQGAAVGMLGQNQGSQALQMSQQKASDIASGTRMAQQDAQAMRQADQQASDLQYKNAFQQSQYQQAVQQLGDTNTLSVMGNTQSEALGNLGVQGVNQGYGDLASQASQANRQNQQQLYGSMMQGAGTLINYGHQAIQGQNSNPGGDE